MICEKPETLPNKVVLKGGDHKRFKGDFLIKRLARDRLNKNVEKEQFFVASCRHFDLFFS